ncbi:hypothetical protein [Paenibacillus humicola]|uniref:hypothetical protein n=1 Tax=Paenibacillus humicola TaxID=3110540 RepID=UPI00237A2132|nr:hypothetical protein [Paenibacillus humicola]
MNIVIQRAEITREPEGGYRGRVLFEAEGHKRPYEVTLLSKNGSSWDYSLSFGRESGPEEQIHAMEAALEEDDELFDTLVDAVMAKLS